MRRVNRNETPEQRRAREDREEIRNVQARQAVGRTRFGALDAHQKDMLNSTPVKPVTKDGA